MFNSKRIAALEKRIRDLESEVAVYSDMEILSHAYRQFGAYGFEYALGLHDVEKKISSGDAIRAIIDHLGLQLKYQKGTPATPERLVLQKPPKKGAK